MNEQLTDVSCHTHESMVAAARALVPTIEAERDAAEIARRPSDPVITEARRLGLFSMMTPKVYGGPELDLDTFFEVGLLLGQVDASHAWVLDFYIEHVWILCQFPEVFQRELFADRTDVLAPVMISPSGRATPVTGGYRLEGRWPWGTGIAHADWVVAGATVASDSPGVIFLAMPAEQVGVEDTWFMDGMCATGSADVMIHDVFVPVERTVDMLALRDAEAPGRAVHPSRLYATPIAPVLMFASSLPVLGQARFAVDEFGRQLVHRHGSSVTEMQSLRPSRQARLGEASLVVDAAEALMRSVLAEVLRERADATEHTRVRWASSLAHAVAMCLRAVEMVCEAAGASSHRLDNPLQRVRRDVHTMACHRVLDLDDRHRTLGRSLLGMPSESYFH